jgi:hypothetical protein
MPKMGGDCDDRDDERAGSWKLDQGPTPTTSYLWCGPDHRVRPVAPVRVRDDERNDDEREYRVDRIVPANG